MKSESRIAQVIDQKLCEHIYAFSEGCGYEAWLEYKKPRDNDPYVELLFIYCPKCGNRLVD